MDVLPRITRQLVELFRAMSPVQRAASGAITAVVLLGFGWLVFRNSGSVLQAASFGKIFASEELALAEQALIGAGLTEFRRDGQRLMVPGHEIDRYNAALVEVDALPADLGAQMLKQYETLGPFSTDRQRQQMKEALLLQELRRMIKAVPDIEDARVAIATSERKTGWNQKPRSTANVTVKCRAGREISTTLINSLRHVVASMVPDLRPSDVTVFDVTRGQAYTGEPTEESSDDRYLQRAREFTREYEQQIQKALQHIPHVNVAVHIDLDALKSSIARSELTRTRGDDVQIANRPGKLDEVAVNHADPHLTAFRGPTETTHEVTEKQLVAAMPKAVQVSVSIPRDYLRDLVSRKVARGEKSPERLDPDLIEEEVLAKVERIVGRLIPADSPVNAISVTCVDRIVVDAHEAAFAPMNERIMTFVRPWRGMLILGLFGVAAAWILRRSPPVTQPSIEIANPIEVQVPQPVPTPMNPIPARPVVVPDRTATLRDEIRSLVAEDPAASAALLGKWLAEAQG
jgi:type III secretory pathway lipoprotein EscJ